MINNKPYSEEKQNWKGKKLNFQQRNKKNQIDYMDTKGQQIKIYFSNKSMNKNNSMKNLGKFKMKMYNN